MDRKSRCGKHREVRFRRSRSSTTPVRCGATAHVPAKMAGLDRRPLHCRGSPQALRSESPSWATEASRAALGGNATLPLHLPKHHLEAIADVGRGITGKPFLVFPNGSGENGPKTSCNKLNPDTDLIMFERSGRARTARIRDIILRPVVENVRIKNSNQSVFENKFVECLSRNVRPSCSRGPVAADTRIERELLEVNLPRLAWVTPKQRRSRRRRASCNPPPSGSADAGAETIPRFFESHPALYEVSIRSPNWRSLSFRIGLVSTAQPGISR